MVKAFLSLIGLIIFFQIGFSQNLVNGFLKDKNTHEPIPYGAIFVFQKGYGVLTNSDGAFQMDITKFSKNDSIKISAIGYENLILTGLDLEQSKERVIYLNPLVYDLTEVKVKPKKSKYLGTSKYTKNNCSAFMGKEGNWKGEQAAIQANNELDVTVYFQSFHFYIVKNLYTDSLTFRLMLYEVGAKGYPGKTFLKKPIIFKTNKTQGEVEVDLKPYDLSWTGDFFISLECLEEKMESSKFCFAGSIKVPSYWKSAFSRWGRVKGGGGDFNVWVTYKK